MAESEAQLQALQNNNPTYPSQLQTLQVDKVTVNVELEHMRTEVAKSAEKYEVKFEIQRKDQGEPVGHFQASRNDKSIYTIELPTLQVDQAAADAALSGRCRLPDGGVRGDLGDRKCASILRMSVL